MEVDVEESIEMGEEGDMETTSPQPSLGMVVDDGEDAAGPEAEDPSPLWSPSFPDANVPMESIEVHEATDDDDDDEAEYRRLRQLAEGTQQASPDARLYRIGSEDNTEPDGEAPRYQPEEAPYEIRWQEEPANEEPRSGGDSAHHHELESGGWDEEALELWDRESRGSHSPEGEAVAGEDREEEEEPRGRGRESAPSPQGRDSAEGESPGRSAGEAESVGGGDEDAATAVGDPVADTTEDLFAGFASLSLSVPPSGPSPEFESWLEGLLGESQD
jgi:hypothetical protein